MTQSRRSLLKSVGRVSAIVLSTAAAGCLDESGNEDASDNDGGVGTNDDQEPGQLTKPNPVVEQVLVPNPDIAQTNVDDDDDNNVFYEIEVVNNGDEGEVIVDFYWIEENAEISDEPTEDVLTLKDSYQVEIGDGGSDSVSGEGVRPEGYDGYWVRTAPATGDVEVRNNGGEGEATVELIEDGVVQDKTTIFLESGGLDIVRLERLLETSEVNFEIQARRGGE